MFSFILIKVSTSVMLHLLKLFSVFYFYGWNMGYHVTKCWAYITVLAVNVNFHLRILVGNLRKLIIYTCLDLFWVPSYFWLLLCLARASIWYTQIFYYRPCEVHVWGLCVKILHDPHWIQGMASQAWPGRSAKHQWFSTFPLDSSSVWCSKTCGISTK